MAKKEMTFFKFLRERYPFFIFALLEIFMIFAYTSPKELIIFISALAIASMMVYFLYKL